MRKVKKVRPYSRLKYNYDYDSKKSRFAVKDKLVQLSCYTDENGVFHFLNDISLLFNQQRLENRIAPSELREMFNRFSPNKSRYLAQLDDDTLLSTLKSKHIQSLSEIKSWTEYCIENFDDLLKAQQAKQNEENGDENVHESVDSTSSGSAAGTSGSAS
jgi:tRNA(Ile)-lysidine synthase TilS/MesJ